MLSEFRTRLITHDLGQQILDAILERCAELGLLRAGGRVRTDATHVIACVRDLNRLELCTETMRCALEALAVAAPSWLATTDALCPDWVERYRQRADSYRLPKGEANAPGSPRTSAATASNSSMPWPSPPHRPTSPTSKPW